MKWRKRERERVCVGDDRGKECWLVTRNITWLRMSVNGEGEGGVDKRPAVELLRVLTSIAS